MNPLEPILKTSTHLFHPDAWSIIRHRDDILPLVASNPGIRLFTQGPIQVLRYLINSPEVFTTAADLECRGLIFDAATGALLSRPLHKFFNIGERCTAADVMARGNGSFFVKLDGSMIGAFEHDGALVFHTKGGVTGHARLALSMADAQTQAMARALIAENMTPAFEWTSPENRVVIPYERTTLSLLAARCRTTGIYHDDAVAYFSDRFGVPRPEPLGFADTLDAFEAMLKTIENRDDIEGAVWCGPNGLRVKAKTRSYRKIHKTISMLSVERHAFRAVVEEMDDDIVPLLHPDQRAAWGDYAWRLRQRFLAIDAEANIWAKKAAAIEDGKARAGFVKVSVPPFYAPVVFGILKGSDGVSVLRGLLERNTGSDTKVQSVKQIYALPSWDPEKGLFDGDTSD